MNTEKVRKYIAARIVVNLRTECHLWQKSLNTNGNGSAFINYKRWLAHRLVYTIHNGTIPKGVIIQHICGNPSCVNIDHLEATTRQDFQTINAWTLGSKNTNAKLTEENIPTIRQMLQDGIKPKAIAKRFNISVSIVSSIKTGRTWRHVDPPPPENPLEENLTIAMDELEVPAFLLLDDLPKATNPGKDDPFNLDLTAFEDLV